MHTWFHVQHDQKILDGLYLICVLLIYFFMFRNAPKLSFSDWNKYLDEISKTKSIEGNQIRNELINCGKPGFSRATVSLKSRLLNLSYSAGLQKINPFKLP